MAQPALNSAPSAQDAAPSEARGQAGYVGLLETLMAATRPAPAVAPAPAPSPRPATGDLDHFTRLLIDTIVKSPRSEQKARIAQLVDAPWLAQAALLELCALPAEVSEPLLRHAHLSDASLFNLLNNHSEGHQVAIARRPGLSNNLVKAILNLPPYLVQLALLNNANARIEPEDMQGLCQLAQNHAALRGALIRHPLFTETHAKALMASVGPDLRDLLSARFPYLSVPATTVTPAQAVGDLKLSALTNGLLLNLLNIGQFDAFLEGMARKLAVDAAKLRHSLNGQSCVSLALSMTALGIDRAAFATVLEQIQRLNHQRPKVTSAHHLLARPVFDLPPAMAREKLAAILS
ncbi:DUF2336 domain-containing protein [Asticcacaulis sp. SL142]|uniref:DUF2336 domain-containing protein n=1 Tax=Asticcacaulis sp. SL142 TaxID=2995155 RepID=UPI00226C866B|nr:DUF2336 domain-containing protein [Asticcacaulis sp. SL142]WAC48564.1 DUF2336 domain-containing protein [Asticcacaulis sp. SL142]